MLEISRGRNRMLEISRGWCGKRCNSVQEWDTIYQRGYPTPFTQPGRVVEELLLRSSNQQPKPQCQEAQTIARQLDLKSDDYHRILIWSDIFLSDVVQYWTAIYP
jgi:hypothetical protein